MAKLTFVLICGLIPSLVAQCGVKKLEQRIGKSVYEFSVDLLTKTAREKDNHFVTSTLSSWSLLTCLSLGASGTTLVEMKEVLKLNNLKCFQNKYMKVVNMIRSNNNSDIVLEGKSNIFASDKINILEKFKTRLTQTGSSEFQSISFENPVLAVDIINNATSLATHGKIDKIVTPEDFQDVLIIMIDTIYFRGSWEIPFPYDKTKVSPFYNEQGQQIGDVNLMDLSSVFNLRNLNRIKARVLELKYGHSEKYSMLIFLPYNEVPLNTVIENLKNFTLKSIYKSFENFGEQEVKVQLPRFQIASDLNLKETLEDMGLHTMFNNRAQFPSITHHPLYVSSFIQKASIEVTEKGTVASAATEADFAFRTFSDEFIVNKPFLFMIVDRHIHVPIFSGAYSKPSIY